MKTHRGIVIGGGIGGLTAAILLSSRGASVTLLEQNLTLGGKLQDLRLGDYRFDFGPSTITMPWIFERVFTEAGFSMDPELEFVKLEVNSRNRFADGSCVDLSSDPERMEEQLTSFTRADREGFHRFLRETGKLYEVASERFFTNSFTEWTDFLSPYLGWSMLHIHAFEDMNRFHSRFFRDRRLLSMMNRYATYVGSSPFQTPATLSLIAYLELIRGVYYVRGGNYRLIEALERLAAKVGVQIVKGATVEEIMVRGGRVCGVKINGDLTEADFVVSNADYYTTQTRLLPPGPHRTWSAREANANANANASRTFSSSGFLMLLGVRKRYDELHHHNLFYPSSYGMEFGDMFHRQIWPSAPALYICHSGYSEPERAMGGSNLYVLANVPSEAGRARLSEEDYKSRLHEYQDKIMELMESRRGFGGLRAQTEVSAVFGPREIAKLSGAYGGALYGLASHKLRSTFFRPSIADRRIQGLYYTGGTTHPGGGTPMVAISGILAVSVIAKRLGLS